MGSGEARRTSRHTSWVSRWTSVPQDHLGIPVWCGLGVHSRQSCAFIVLSCMYGSSFDILAKHTHTFLTQALITMTVTFVK